MMHDKYALPWDYELRVGTFTLRSHTCTGKGHVNDRCIPCGELKSNSVLQGIQDRIVNGVKAHSPHTLHGAGGLSEVIRRKDNVIDQLRLTGLNGARHLISIEGALDITKQILIAASNGSGNARRLSVAIRNAFARNLGLHAILELVKSTVKGTHNPKSFDEEDDAQGWLMLLLGGQRVADIAHRAFGTPATSTLRQRNPMPRLLLSPSTPTSTEIERNIDACFEALSSLLMSGPILHAILMYDEIATEKRPRYDDETNRIVGGSREDGAAASVEYRSAEDLDTYMDDVERGEVRLASEVRTRHNKCLHCGAVSFFCFDKQRLT